MSLALLRPRVMGFVRDPSAAIAVPGGYDELLQGAVREYSRARPREVVEDVAGTGAYDYAMPASWTPGFSQLLQVEYPAGERDPRLVDVQDRALYRGAGGAEALRFFADTPRTGETIRLLLTAPHTIAENATSVPAQDFDAVVLLASSLGCEQLASRYSSAIDPSMHVGLVDQKTQATEFAARAKRFRDLADRLLPGDQAAGGGGDGRAAAAASEQASWGEHEEVWPPLTHRTRG